ncbi:hypothetical protein ACIQU1_20305 [Streptomyces angustmyceticus]|uniref:Orn/Lys/Arg family decarboxylase n=1 Tax=Streptomyces angustmyceticus TaxID=285578 RepID=UPI00382AEA44
MRQTCLPRDAFFGAVKDVPVSQAVGRLAAEMLPPSPPGIPAAVPGELLTEPVLDCPSSGVDSRHRNARP